MDFLLLIHRNFETPPAPEAWEEFIGKAIGSGMFRGGSGFGDAKILGNDGVKPVASILGGYMRFHADQRKELEDLLASHPVVRRGGSVELVELPVTS